MYSPDALAAFIIYMGIAIALIGVISAVLVLSVKLYLSIPKRWIVVVKHFEGVSFIKAFRSDAQATRYANRMNKWRLEQYRAIHYTTWADYLQGEDGIA